MIVEKPNSINFNETLTFFLNVLSEIVSETLNLSSKSSNPLIQEILIDVLALISTCKAPIVIKEAINLANLLKVNLQENVVGDSKVSYLDQLLN